jgi:hypothetical protein
MIINPNEAGPQSPAVIFSKKHRIIRLDKGSKQQPEIVKIQDKGA